MRIKDAGEKVEIHKNSILNKLHRKDKLLVNNIRENNYMIVIFEEEYFPEIVTSINNFKTNYIYIYNMCTR